MGMMVWGVLSFLFGLLVLFLFILAAAYGVKWVWGQRPSSTTGRGESALDVPKSAMRKVRSVKMNMSRSKGIRE